MDTNIIIEAVRVGCWGALKAHFSVETVEKCAEEARTGDLYRAGYVAIDERALRERLKVHPVSDLELAALALRDPMARLDPGERHLWAHALGRPDVWVASCCDRAAVEVAVRLGWEDRLKSLEELTLVVGARPAAERLKGQFSTARLSSWRADALIARGIK